MALIRKLAAGDVGFERLVPAAFSAAMPAATRYHAAEQITPQLQKRLSGMPMMSTGSERRFALGRAYDVCAGASRDDTRAGVIPAMLTAPRPGCESSRSDLKEEWKLLRKIGHGMASR
eukprot:1492608-Pleurochrysis_carterae.AAC.1